MNDRTIIRILEETSHGLERMHGFEPCQFLLPSYNALLEAARANHPEDRFLGVLPNLDVEKADEITSGSVQVLVSQLRIAIESMQEDAGAPTRDLRDREG